MAEETLSARLVEIESMLDRSRRRFEEGTRLVEEAHKLLGDIQQVIMGSPRSVSPEDSEEAASKLLASLRATGGEMPETLCGGRLSVDQVQRLIRIDGHPIGIRSTVWDPDTRIVDKGSTTLQILSAPAANSNVATAQAGQ